MQKVLQAAQGYIHLRGKADRLTSVVIPVGFACVAAGTVVKSLYGMYTDRYISRTIVNMPSSSTCSQEQFPYSPVVSGASSGSDCGSPRGSCSPTYHAAGAAASGATHHHPNDVAGMVRKINEMLANSPQMEADNVYNGKNIDSSGEVIPSGPRKPGQGCEEAHQAIMLAEATATSRTVSLRITLLAAGFIIGPIGGCVREISRLSGASIRSRTVQADSLCHRDCREFTIEGPTDAAVAHAMSIIIDAVNRYKTLCEGKCAGQVVPRSQHVAGVEFFYQPPPRSVVPFAACLKGHSKRGTATSCNNKEFTKDLPSSKEDRGGHHYNAPPPPPRTSFKAAVVGLDSSEAIEQQQNINSGICMVPSLRSSPLKRAATSPPGSLFGSRADIGAGNSNTTATEILSGHPMLASKLTKINNAEGSYSLFEGLSNAAATTGAGAAVNASAAGVLAAAAAAVGLPYVSFGSDGSSSFSHNSNVCFNKSIGNVGGQQVLVPLNLLLASQNLFPQQNAQKQQQQQQQQASHNQAYHQQQATTNYSASEILSALSAQLQTNLGFENLQTQHAQQAQRGVTANTGPTSDAPSYGHYYADMNNSNNTGSTHASSMFSPFAALATPFQTTTGVTNSTTPSTTTTAATSPLSMSSPASVALCGPGGGLGSRNSSDTSLFGDTIGANTGIQRALYQAFSTESDVSNSISQLANTALGGIAGSNSALRSAFALPSFFHGESPVSGTPASMSRATSLLTQTESMLSRDSSLRTSMEGPGDGGRTLSNAASGGLNAGFGSYVFPRVSATATTTARAGEQQQHQQQQQQHQPPMTIAAALQQWDLLASVDNQFSDSAALSATPAAWEAQNPFSAVPSTSSPYYDNNVNSCARGAIDDADVFYSMLPKSIWSLE
ncbi:hypothetical protein Ndes2526B_g02500 [Nannochloris sp. 'desiccata']